MQYTVRPRHDHGIGSFNVIAADADEALDIAKGMTERGVREIEILDESGTAFNLSEWEQRAQEDKQRR
jgi:hypothetical protein